VYVDWKLIDGKLEGEIIFNEPLSTKGNAVGNNVRALLKKLNISDENFGDLNND